MSSKKNAKKDVTWDHCVKVEGASRMKIKCKYCEKEYWGGVFRIKHHLAGSNKDVAPCVNVPDNVREMFIKILGDLEKIQLKKKNIGGDEIFEDVTCTQDDVTKKGKLDVFVTKGKGGSSSNPKQKTMNEMLKDREGVIGDICRCIYGNALPFNLVRSPLFKKMLKSIGDYGKGLNPPTFHEVRESYLKKEVDNVQASLEKYKIEWKKNGCTLMCDGWTDGRGRSLTNFLVNSPRGTIFLKSIDTSDVIKDAIKMFELLDGVVEEIGEENVVQVVTDSASALVAAGHKLEEKRTKLFWSPCAAHCIDLILEDIGKLPIFHNTISKAKQITIFIYRHAWVLALYRKYSKGKKLARPAITRFATSYLTLKCIMERKCDLTSMFASRRWATSAYATRQEGKNIVEIVLRDRRFWNSIQYCLKCVTPLVSVLRLVDGDSKPAMPYIYEAMDRAKEQIATNFDNKEERYKQVWKIIDTRWNLQLHRPLHAAAYFLNPK